MTKQTYHFSLVLTGCDDVVGDMTQEAFLKLSDQIFAAGCDDASPGVMGGEVVIDFDRDAFEKPSNPPSRKLSRPDTASSRFAPKSTPYFKN